MIPVVDVVFERFFHRGANEVMAPLQSNGKIPPNSTLADVMLTYAKVYPALLASVVFRQ